MSEGMGKGDDIFEGIAIEGVDIGKGKNDFPDGVYADVLRAWYKHTPANLEKLRSLAGGGQLSNAEVLREYTIVVHGLKGASYGICAGAVGKAAENLEAASRSGDIPFIEANNEPLVKEASLLHARLHEFFESCAGKAGAKPKAGAPDAGLLAEFLNACKQFKSSVMEDTLKKLEELEYESSADLVPWLRDQTDNLEYEAIQERLEKELA
jgi:hypothetical protein